MKAWQARWDEHRDNSIRQIEYAIGNIDVLIEQLQSLRSELAGYAPEVHPYPFGIEVLAFYEAQSTLTAAKRFTENAAAIFTDLCAEDEAFAAYSEKAVLDQ